METRQRYALVEALFHTALDKGDEAFRQACGSDAALLAEVTALLQSHAQWAVDLPVATPLALPRVGAYVCDAVLGTGGMGTVYRAHRVDGEFEQEVAIKLLRGSLQSDWYRERFLAERQILARLSHPHIARLLDGGTTDEGEIYLVMELVSGEPIDRYADRGHLTLHQRLVLFDRVLDAVDYAHRNLVVHRDLKPSNVLVESAGRVKLIDFGTSKLVEEDATATSLRALTPRYASPEQLRGEPAGVASDVFSAGVLLYELLVGVSPFGDDTSIVGTLARASGNAAPRDPAAAVTTDAARVRKTNVRSLRGVLARDLGSVLLRALAAEPSERYLTISSLRDDLKRYRSGLPVEAKPAGALYTAAKFIRRHRLSVAASALFILGLSASTAVAFWQARSARQAAQRTERINTFMNTVLGGAAPGWSNPLSRKGAGVTLLDVLTEMRGRIGPELGDDPASEVRLRVTLGRTFGALGKPTEAREELEAALARQRAISDPDDPEIGGIYASLAQAQYLALQAGEGLRTAEAAIAILEKSGRARDKQPLMEAYYIASLLRSWLSSPSTDVEAASQRALQLSRELHGDDMPTPLVMYTQGYFALGQGKLGRAEALINESIDLYRRQPGPPAWETAAALRDIGVICLEKEQFACADERLGEALTLFRQNLPDDNAYVTMTRAYLALSDGLQGRYQEAQREFEEVSKRMATVGSGTAAGLMADIGVARARVYLAERRPDEAEPLLRQAVEIFRARQNVAANAVIASLLGESLLASGKREEALPLLEQSYKTLADALGPDEVWTSAARSRLARAGSVATTPR
jgi:eukaryotic-like serine/threonine-protein kinase